jgi:molybdopterin synthase sulfur carrier subunit
MTVQVKLPSMLRTKTGGIVTVAVTASTVAEALRQLECALPQLTPSLRDDQGQIRPGINVYVNDVHVRFQRGLDTRVEDGDQVYVVPLVMGG